MAQAKAQFWPQSAFANAIPGAARVLILCHKKSHPKVAFLELLKT
jgi:hypothetical protein